MIDTVLFDMGGTLEDIYVDDASKEASAREVLRLPETVLLLEIPFVLCFIVQVRKKGVLFLE